MEVAILIAWADEKSRHRSSARFRAKLADDRYQESLLWAKNCSPFFANFHFYLVRYRSTQKRRWLWITFPCWE